ncbi:hypothetical protein GCK32_007700 [Trichostrongylus colubriformis]|uniref:Uncharacterized protein n=1 Tax=Trichostrongylus colubriformis TaxID=6319 RepID=A0AAN8IVK2_TRICO
MYSHYPRQVCVDGGLGRGGSGATTAAAFRSSPQALITYEVVETQQDDAMLTTNTSHHQQLQNSPSVPENSLDSSDTTTRTPRVSPQHLRIDLQNRARKETSRQFIVDEEEMIKIPSPEKLNSMMRGVELNLYASGAVPQPHTPQTPQPPYTPNGQFMEFFVGVGFNVFQRWL